MLIESSDYVVRFAVFPPSIHGLSVVDEDGRLNIYINELDCRSRQLETFRHEICHFVRNDFWNFLPIQCIENMAACH